MIVVRIIRGRRQFKDGCRECFFVVAIPLSCGCAYCAAVFHNRCISTCLAETVRRSHRKSNVIYFPMPFHRIDQCCVINVCCKKVIVLQVVHPLHRRVVHRYQINCLHHRSSDMVVLHRWYDVYSRIGQVSIEQADGVFLEFFYHLLEGRRVASFKFCEGEVIDCDEYWGCRREAHEVLG